MVRLNDTERIEILMMIGYGDRRQSCAEVMNIFNEAHPDRQPISKPTIARTLKRFLETGDIKDRPKSGRSINVTTEESYMDVLLDVVENPKTSVQQIAINHNMSRYSIRKILGAEDQLNGQLGLPI